MKVLKSSLIVLAAACMIIGLGSSVYAFHQGGVAECEGCHTMHNALDGGTMTTNGTPVGVANPYLLQGADQSSTCLNCHAGTGGYHIMTYPFPGAGVPPSNYTPGGDFAYLAKTYSWVPRSGAATAFSEGYRHGHNIVAADFGLDTDPRFAGGTSPGGNYPYPASGSGVFACISCHDPHGKSRILSDGTLAITGEPIYESGSYGTDPTVIGTTGLAVGIYRLLGTTGYAPESQPAAPFTQPAMFAAAKGGWPGYNIPSPTGTENRVAYGRNSAEWCANCHNAMHSVLSTVPGGLVHPTGVALGTTIMDQYNAYLKTGDNSNNIATAYLGLTSFQTDNVAVNSALATVRDTTAGPSNGDRVICFSCHKAHASGWDSMTRFPLGNEIMTLIDGAGNPVYPDPAANPAEALGRTAVEYQAALDGLDVNELAPYQRVLCNKCHVKD